MPLVLICNAYSHNEKLQSGIDCCDPEAEEGNFDKDALRIMTFSVKPQPASTEGERRLLGQVVKHSL